MLRLQAAISVPKSLQWLGTVWLLGVALIGIGWWRVLPGPLPGDEYYALERAAAYTLRSLISLPQPLDAPAIPPPTGLGLGISLLAFALAVAGTLVRLFWRRIHAWLLCRAASLVLLVPSEDSADPLPDESPGHTLAVLGGSPARMRSGQHLRLPLDESFVSQLLPRCASNVRELLALGPDSKQNLELATRLVQARRGAVSPALLARLRLRIDSRPLRIALARDGLSELATRIADTRLTSMTSARCRRLLRDQPPNKVRVVERGGQPALVVIGLRETGFELLARLCAQAQCPSLDPLRLVIVDTDAIAVERQLRELWPGLDLLVQLTPLTFEAQLPQSSDRLLRSLNVLDLVPTCVYLALEERELCEAWRRELSLACRAAGDAAPLVLPVRFARPADAVRSLLAEEETLDAIPRRMHADYVARQRAAGVTSGAAIVDWEALSFDLQEDNRSSADHFWVKARAMGLQIVPDVVGLNVLSDGPLLEPLAQAEHRRWTANRVLMGWRFGISRSDSARIHPSIQAWDCISEAERDKDRAVVRDLPKALAAAGHGVKPLVLHSLQVRPEVPHDELISMIAAATKPNSGKDGTRANILMAVDDGHSFRLAGSLAALPGIAVSLIVTRSLDGLAIQAGLSAEAGMQLAEAAWEIWITTPAAVEGIRARRPELKLAAHRSTETHNRP